MTTVGIADLNRTNFDGSVFSLQISTDDPMGAPMVPSKTVTEQRTSRTAEIVPAASLRLQRALFVFGFLLHVNFRLPEFMHIRYITDLFAAALAIPSILFCLKGFKPVTNIMYFGLITMIFALSFIFRHEKAASENYNNVMIFFYFITAIGLTRLLRDAQTIAPLCWGMCWGFFISVLVLIGDATLHLPFSSIGLAPAFDAELEQQNFAKGLASLTLRLDKAGGLWAAGNEAGPVLALAGAAAAWLSQNYKNARPFKAFLALYVASFAFTLNRSGLIAVAALALLIVFHSGLNLRFALKAVVTVLLASVLLIVGYLLGFLDVLGEAVARKFLDDANVASNFEDRITTTLAGVQMLFLYPFGIGQEARFAAMLQATNFRTPHNGFIAMGFDFGLLGAVLLAASTVYILTRGRKDMFYFYSCVVFTISLFFEELLSNPVFMLTAGLVVARAMTLWCGEDDTSSRSRRQASRRRPFRPRTNLVNGLSAERGT